MAKKSIFHDITWKTIKCSKTDLRLDIVLKCGQSFRWSSVETDDKIGAAWTGVLANRVFLLSQNDKNLMYKAYPKTKEDTGDEDTLKDYFQLHVDLGPLYKEWAKSDPIFKKISETFPGVRMLRQDPVENVFSFICSSNNNIERFQLHFITKK